VRGDLEDALRWVELFNIREPGDQLPESSAEAYHVFRIRKYEQLILARLYLAQDQPAEALQLLDALRPKFEKIDRMVQVIEILVLRARALNALGRLDEGLAALANALTLAEPEGYLRIFLDEGQAIEGLLLKIKVEDLKLRTYVQKLCTAFAVERGSPPGQMIPLSREDSRQPLIVEPLSQREMEVLGFLASPLTADEIADQLVVSVHTVRSHIKSIYSKLGAHSRLEAVEKARAYQLL
jgi:LuxR family maltose regulon positive regulatory protein